MICQFYAHNSRLKRFAFTMGTTSLACCLTRSIMPYDPTQPFGNRIFYAVIAVNSHERCQAQQRAGYDDHEG